eukprot:gene4277-biopygen12500
MPIQADHILLSLTNDLRDIIKPPIKLVEMRSFFAGGTPKQLRSNTGREAKMVYLNSQCSIGAVLSSLASPRSEAIT